MAVYLHNLGMVNSLGATKEAIWQNVNKQTTNYLNPNDELIPDKSIFLGMISETLLEIPQNLSNYDNRNNQLLITAYQQIKDDFEQLSDGLKTSRIAIILGTSTAAMAEAEQELAQVLSGDAFSESYDFINQEVGGGDQFLSEYLKLDKAIHYTVSTACSSSAKALIAAKHLIESDIVDLAIAGGADSLCKLTLNGFNALESLSNNICKPFSEDRDGINIGEGVALFLLSKQRSAIKLSGAGETSDAYHMSAPDPSAKGATMAMQQALAQAQLEPIDIDYLNLHGTATPKNDEMEARAISETFAGNLPWMSSTKHLTGHMLGAAGASEIGFCWLALTMGTEWQGLPANQKDIGDEFSQFHFVSRESVKSATIRHCMSNSFAFGGNNISVIISKEDAAN